MYLDLNLIDKKTFPMAVTDSNMHHIDMMVFDISIHVIDVFDVRVPWIVPMIINQNIQNQMKKKKLMDKRYNLPKLIFHLK